MTTLDDLAHSLEVEAEVLRAISHMAPSVASDFLFALALKVRRVANPTTLTKPNLERFDSNGEVAPSPICYTPPELPASPTVTAPPPQPEPPQPEPPKVPSKEGASAPLVPSAPEKRRYGARVEAIMEVVTRRGKVQRWDLQEEVARMMGEEHDLKLSKKRTNSALWQLKHMGQKDLVESDDFVVSLRST